MIVAAVAVLGVALPGSAPKYDQGCISVETAQPCVDPTEWGDGDAELTPQEAASICALKCPELPDDYPFHGGPFLDEDGQPLDITGPFDICTVASAQVDTTAMTCEPGNPSQTAPWESEVAPSHEGSLSSNAPESHAEISINGVPSEVELSGEVLLGISDCEGRARQEVCVLNLQSLALDLASSPVFGDYQVDTAQIMLNLPTRTTASFVCDAEGCFGSFDFLALLGTSVETDLVWDQTNVFTKSVGGGGLALGKGKVGSLSRVSGELKLDSTKSQGSIRIWGDGQDSFGGDVASVTFDLRGPVSAYAP